MLNLVDGPAKGTYWCKASPLFLRAVVDADGEADVLDQVSDEPRRSETLSVYRREPGELAAVHINSRKHHGVYAVGTYKHLPEVDGEALRDNQAWREWMRRQLEDLKGKEVIKNEEAS